MIDRVLWTIIVSREDNYRQDRTARATTKPESDVSNSAAAACKIMIKVGTSDRTSIFNTERNFNG